MKDYFTKKEQMGILIIALIVISFGSFKLLLPKILEKKEPLQIVNNDIINEDNEEKENEKDSIIMIHISGQVYNPGLIELRLGSRVKDAVDLAGGLKKDADLDRINLAKKLADEEKIYVPMKGEEVAVDIASSIVGAETSNIININTCTKEQLKSLPGIGEVTADKILDYRSKTKFSIIEDIMNVSGIGSKKFDAIKELIIVN